MKERIGKKEPEIGDSMMAKIDDQLVEIELSMKIEGLGDINGREERAERGNRRQVV